MAGEDLGSAKLILTADDRDLSEKLRAAKKQVDELARQAGVTGDAFSKFFSRNYRLSINDSQLVAANTRLSNLQAKLKEIAASPINVRLNIIEGGVGAGGSQVTRETLAEQFRQATSGGLSGQLSDILAGDIGAQRTASLRSTLLARLERGSLSAGGFNVPGLREVITQLGGTPTGGRTQLLAQAQKLVKTVNDAIINKVGQDLLDLKLQLGAGPPTRTSAAAIKRQRDIASNALIGGAFPLLFGQGIGASAGGALGGAAGGAIGGQFGFGLSLLGTAVGAQFDAIIQKAGTLSKALNDPINSFGEVTQAGLLSSKGLERQVQALIAVGREAEAAALIQQDLANSYGGAEAARALAESQDQLNRSWTQLSVNLGQLALPVFAAAADDAASSLGGLLAILRSIANLRLPEAPPQGPSASTLARGGLRGLAAFAGGGPVGFLGALGGEVSRFFGRNRPAAATSTGATAAAESKRSSLLSNQYKLITAQVQGYKDLALQAERQISLDQEALDIANLRARKAGDPAVDERRRQGSQERFRIDEELRNLERDRARTAQENERRSAEESAKRASALRLISSETEIQAGAIERQLQNAQALAQVEAGILRDALAQRQAIEESTASAVERERALRAELGEAQALGDETAIFRATTQLYLAAGQTKLALIDGARALSDAGRSLKDNILNAQRSIRSTLEDSFDLLRAPIQQQLLEQARGRINFSLFDVGRVRTPSEIFGAAAASESIAAQQQIIAQSSTALVDVNSQLAKVTKELADKKWDVAVNVLGASGAQIIGDVVGATA